MMTRDNFLLELNDRLRSLPPYERSEIIADYTEHFRSGQEEGLTDLEIIHKLGSPGSIASQYLSEFKDESTNYQYDSRSKGINILAAIALIFFNLVFVLGPAMGVIGILIGFGGLGLGLVFGGAGLALSIIANLNPFLFIAIPKNATYFFLGHPVLAVVTGIGSIAVGGLVFIGLFYLTKFLINVANRYISWNRSVITGS